MLFDTEILKSLLKQNEGITLDFKRQQYKFQKTNDYQKSELLKDILAFSNTYRTTDAFILIGVEEIKGNDNKVIGVNDHLNESNIQEFINQKTNKPVSFTYNTIEFDNKKIDVLKIPIQSRPIFLKKDFGQLKANTVYIRRGSATDIANPDEISNMKSVDISSLLEKRLIVYQEAYEISIELKSALGPDMSEKIRILQKAREWFNKNNLYLNADLRNDIDDTVYAVSIHDVIVKNYYSSETPEKYEKLISNFDSIVLLPKRIQESLDIMLKE